MTNREWLSKMSNKELGALFCDEVAKDGWYCERCPFSKYCTHGDSGFENFLNEEHKND